jgi:hypothetical protein
VKGNKYCPNRDKRNVQRSTYDTLPQRNVEPINCMSISVLPCQGDVDQPTNTNKDPLYVSNRPMTPSKTKALKEALNALVLKVPTKSNLKGPLEYQEHALVHLIHVQEGLNPNLFEP